ncbi:MAG TPA: hypothetical protein VF681_11250 [Abditibacteriaceae bacterium]
MKTSIFRSTWTTKTIATAFIIGSAVTAPAQQGGQGGNNRPNWQNMTPEQRQQMEARRTEQRNLWLRQAMTGSGVTDAAAQTAIIDYMTEQEKTRVSLQEQARALSAVLVKPETPDAELKTKLEAYRAAVAAADAQRTADLSVLDEQVKYSTSPRVETLLSLLGVLGNETAQLGGIGALFPESPYSAQGGRGGRGGQGGQGGRGGRGGQGGQNGNGGPGGQE